MPSRTRRSTPNPRSESKTTRLRNLVGERDGWLCYRCRGPIDRTLRWPDPYSPSLEHIVELCRGGDPYDETNCTVSHLRHNLSAGAALGNRRRAEQRIPTRPERILVTSDLTW